jgi:Fic/DOC family
LSHACEEWEYNTIPDYAAILSRRVQDLLAPIFQAGFKTSEKASDTRPSHRALFKGLTPALYPHFAGNYRGAPKECLVHRLVFVPLDARVGSHPDIVAGEMDQLRQAIVTGLESLDSHLPNLTRGEFLIQTIRFGCAVFEEFLRIHPYANGNGHMARYILWIVLARYGFHIRKFPVEPRPPEPRYTRSIKAHRDGNAVPLESFVLECVDPEDTPPA